MRAAASPFTGVWLNEPVRRPPNQFASRLAKEGRADLAEEYWQHLLRLSEDSHDGPHSIPDSWRGAAAFALGSMNLTAGQLGRSVAYSQMAVDLLPDDYRPHANLGAAYLQLQDAETALPHLDAALMRSPNRASVLTNRATALHMLGRVEEAIRDWEKTLSLKPEDQTARSRLAASYLGSGDDANAVRHFQELLQREPESITYVGTLAWLLATSPDASVRDGPAAVRHAQHWVDATDRRDPKALNALAAALAETGRFDAAVAAMESAIEIGRRAGNAAMLDAFFPRLELYRAEKPFHRPAASGRP